MPLLWEKRELQQPKTIQKRPSPKHNNHILSFAQSYHSNLCKLSDAIKGASLFISKGGWLSASMTVEAALVLPLFLFFFLNLMYSIEMIRLHGNLQLALWETGNRMTVYGSVLSNENTSDERQTAAEAESGWRETMAAEAANGWRTTTSADGQARERQEEQDSWWMELAGVVWSYTYVKAQITEYLGEEYLEQSPLTYGADGLQFLESNVWEGEDCFEVVVTYSVSPLCGISAFRPFRMANRYYGHLWNGYQLPGTETLFVYVAENGEVYHTDRNCTHLKLSVRQVTWQQAHASRNAQGKSYTACEKCGVQGAAAVVYITDEGECYHFNSDCPGLKRTVACIALSEAGDLRQCQRCAKAK